MKIPPAKVVIPEEDRKGILEKINESMETGQLTLGKYGKEFETEFAKYNGNRYAIAVNSGTCGLEICLRILGIKDKEVIIPSNTFFATVLAVLHAGGKVRFVDMDTETFSINIDDLQKKISKETIGVIIVHIGGLITSKIMDIQKLCEDKGLFLLEDAAHAHGSSLGDRKAGQFGIAGIFSFYPTKVMTSGEGGMIVTDSEKIEREARLYRDQGKVDIIMNIHNRLGYNWRMSEIHAILGSSQLKRLEQFIQQRNRIAKLYDSFLINEKKLTILKPHTFATSNYYKYIVILKEGIDRIKLKKDLKEKHNVSLSGEVYGLPCHLQPYFEGSYKKGNFPLTEDMCSRHICLPIYAGMKDEEAVYVVESLVRCI